MHGSNQYGSVEYRTYRAWQMMKQRCTNPKTNGFARYGGAGISYCKEWEKFTVFLNDVGVAPTIEHTLDRIESAKNYEPGNVRWATKQQQQSNLRSNKRITFNGVTRTQAEWARFLGVSRQCIGDRVRRLGASAAIAEGGPKTRTEIANLRWIKN